jgi:RimJ/RimL family protein N-acetyltransferase
MPTPASQIVEIPILATERLLLRGRRLDDFPPNAAMWADPVVTRYIRETPFTEEESWTRFLRHVGHWSLMGFGYWVIEQKDSREFLGEVGFADYKRELQPSLKGIPEIGWALAAGAHGKGYATEAVRAVTTWGDANFGPVRTACLIDPKNEASIRVATKCGYRELQPATYKGYPVIMFDRQPPPKL